MTNAAIQALTAEHRRAVELMSSLTAAEWQAPSGCTGWRVQDVIQHMASTFHTIADPTSIDGGSSSHAEENAEVPVRARRDWTTAEVAAEYHEWAAKGIEALTALQEPPMADMVVPLADLGSHPMRLLANAIVFDHYCHLRHDIGAAIPRAAALPHDALALDATVEWMLAGLPQMCATALAGCTQGVNLTLVVGDTSSSYALRPGDAGESWTITSGRDQSLPTASSGAHDFVSWGTKRSDWRDCGVEISDQAAATTLDAINVI